MENELDIELAQRPSHQAFYTSGDLVRGNVILYRPTKAQGVGPAIKFSGIARSKIGPQGNIHQPSYSNEALLFQFTQDLYKGSHSIEEKKHTWPFAFTFPSSTQSASKKDRYSTNSNFHRNSGHALPPSWMGGSTSEVEEYSYVCYQLEVTFTNGVTKSSSRRRQKRLSFSPVRETKDYRPFLTPISQSLSRSSPLLDPRFRGHDCTIDGHYQCTIAGRQPSSHFNLRVDLPEMTYAGAQILMSIGVEHDMSRSTAPVIPTIFLKRFSISLKTITQVRAPGGFLRLGQEPHESWSEESILADSGLLHLPLYESLDVHDFIKDLSITDSTFPTFKTYNIARTYVLHMKIEIDCAQKLYGLEMERPLFLLPAVYNMIGFVVPRAQVRMSPADEPPPPYEAIETSAEGQIGAYRLPSFDTAIAA